MAWWSRFTERDAFPELEAKAADVYGLTWAALNDGVSAVKSGVSVNIDSALRVSTVLACARVLSQGIAQMPLRVLREGADESKLPAKDHPAYKLLHRRPNEWMTSFEFRETMMFHAVLCEGAYAYIGRGMGKLVELIPLVPGRVRPKQSTDYGLTFEVTDSTGKVTTLPRENVLHLHGPSWNGYAGMSAITLAREAIGLAMATEETHARLHSNGAQPGGILSFKEKLTPEAKAQLATDWRAHQAGVSNRFKTVVLDMDATFKAMAMSGVDNQHIETRRYQVEEVCRDLCVFPQMIGHTDKTATFASAEAFFLAHVVHSLGPWVERWEQVFARDLFPDEPEIVAKFSVQGLLRGDNKTRAEFYASGIVNGWLTRNEARRYEDLNPLDGLDQPLVPLNMGTQAERDAAAKDITDAVKSMLGHNGGPALDDEQADALETKIGRVLSARNERRIVTARDELSAVLAELPAPVPEGE